MNGMRLRLTRMLSLPSLSRGGRRERGGGRRGMVISSSFTIKRSSEVTQMKNCKNISFLHRQCYHPRQLDVSRLMRIGSVSSSSSSSVMAACHVLVSSVRGVKLLGKLLATASPSSGDVMLLKGDLGAGKTETCRAYIRAVTGMPDLVVPSPTYLLQQIYDDDDCNNSAYGINSEQVNVPTAQKISRAPPIHHYDLYRLETGSDMDFLNLKDSFTSAVALVEWAERLDSKYIPSERLELDFKIVTEADRLSFNEHVRENKREPSQRRIMSNPYFASMEKLFIHKMDMLLSSNETLLGCDGDDDDADYDDDANDLTVANEEALLFLETNELPRTIKFTAYGRKWSAFVNSLSKVIKSQSIVPHNPARNRSTFDLSVID